MKDFLVDLALPRSDRVVFIQTVVMAVFWLITIVTTRRWSRDIRMFIYGVAMLNVAWFALRTVH